MLVLVLQVTDEDAKAMFLKGYQQSSLTSWVEKESNTSIFLLLSNQTQMRQLFTLDLPSRA